MDQQRQELFAVGFAGHLRASARMLQREFDGVFCVETVERYLHETFAELESRARVNRFTPLLAERAARSRLREVAAWRARADLPAVLFVASADPARALLAQALLQRTAGASVTAWASSTCADPREALVGVALREVGIDDPVAAPVRYGDDLVQAADVVVTLAGDACPLLDQHQYLDWSSRLRAESTLDDVRRTRDQLADRVVGLASELGLPRVA